ncbi:2-oxo-tetronate isomerase [Desulfovibrio litoralis]|uniref:Hydroxypyruvate isomerase n=1 Tax=Desulfovibrio litoralis DSM 11393 TaxID=1121455 RepID=A0A1M7TMG3_9BACT|nr:2-oxo-tetronate isomerase [Desulfovibrio litoralis]SHN71922.1 hydroxypyruvate isomerase [Desulfovibrio litoralis DSM 11393]
MPKFAANLTMMFNEYKFEDRFSAAADAGFKAVEYLFPYDFEPDFLAKQLEKNNLTQALFNLYPGNWEKGERGLACLPGREDEFIKSVEKAIPYAKAFSCQRLHAMAGLTPQGIEKATLLKTYKENIAQAANLLKPHGITLCLEPINQRSMPGYFLNKQGDAVEIIKELNTEHGTDNVKLQFDCFHCQMEEGAVSLKLREFFPYTAHYQIAGVPERHEPNTGELNYAYIFNLIDELGYQGYIGCEYIPLAKTVDGLSWFTAL